MRYQIDKTKNTPYFCYNEGNFEISGRSIPVDPKGFYYKVSKFINEYSKHPQKNTYLDVKLEALNSCSNRSLFNVFKKLDILYNNGREVKVNWYYQDEEDGVYEMGTIFKSMLNVPFDLIANVC